MTDSELLALKAALLADTDQAVIDAVTGGNHTEIARLYNLPSSTIVWRTSVPVPEVFDAIVWANMTPAAVPDGTALWTNRNLQCQSKQLALQTILMGREQINATKANIRAGLQDALTAIPSKSDGSNQAAGWLAVVPILKRAATKAEAVYATGTGTDANPALLVWEGQININDVGMAMNS
jgi:hypothetical protein